MYFCTVNINRIETSITSVKTTMLQHGSSQNQKFSKIEQEGKEININDEYYDVNAFICLLTSY